MSTVVALSVVVLAEVTVRANARALPQPLGWGTWEEQYKVEKMLRVRHDFGGASIVAVGSSMVDLDVAPNEIERIVRPSRPVFNAALTGADARLARRWTTEVVIPLLHPDMVVIGVSSRDFNDAGTNQSDFYRDYARSPEAVRRSGSGPPLARLNAEAWRHSYLVRYRQELREPGTWDRDSLQRNGSSVRPFGVLVDAEKIQSRPYSVTEDFRRRTTRHVLERWTMGTASTRALRSLLSSLQASGIRAVVVKMPITSDAIAMHPDPGDYARFERTIERITAESATPLVDLTTEFPPTAHDKFVDPFHLNRRAKVAFSDGAAAALVRT